MLWHSLSSSKLRCPMNSTPSRALDGGLCRTFASEMSDCSTFTLEFSYSHRLDPIRYALSSRSFRVSILLFQIATLTYCWSQLADLAPFRAARWRNKPYQFDGIRFSWEVVCARVRNPICRWDCRFFSYSPDVEVVIGIQYFQKSFKKKLLPLLRYYWNHDSGFSAVCWENLLSFWKLFIRHRCLRESRIEGFQTAGRWSLVRTKFQRPFVALRRTWPFPRASRSWAPRQAVPLALLLKLSRTTFWRIWCLKN